MNQGTAFFAKLLKAKLPLIYKRLHTLWETFTLYSEEILRVYNENERWRSKGVKKKKKAEIRGGGVKDGEINFITSVWVIIALLQCWKSCPHIPLFDSHLCLYLTFSILFLALFFLPIYFYFFLCVQLHCYSCGKYFNHKRGIFYVYKTLNVL